MMKLTHITNIIAVAVLLALAGCSGRTESSGPVVSVEPQRVLLQEIVGDCHTVSTLLSNGANPESFEPTVRTRMAVDAAPVFFATGLLPFENSLRQSLSDKVTVVDCSEGIEKIYGTHGHEHYHGEGEDADHGAHGDADHGDDHDGHGHADLEADPHIWVSVRNARVIARSMLQAMQKLEPENAGYYAKNFERLDARLDSLDKAYSAAFAALPASQRAFAVWHPSLSYFARDYGLEQIAVGFENKEKSPRHIAGVVEQAKAHGVRVLFYQAETDSRQASTLNDAMGTQMVTLNLMDAGWLDALDKVKQAMTASNTGK